MTHLLYLLPALACPVGMGAMMWLMMRGGKSSKVPTPPGTTDAAPMNAQQEVELAQLRAEIEQLKNDTGVDLRGSGRPPSPR